MQKQILNIKGMTCQMCVKHVTKALANLDGVQEVEVSLEANTANIVFDPASVGMADFKTAIANAGYEVVTS